MKEPIKRSRNWNRLLIPESKYYSQNKMFLFVSLQQVFLIEDRKLAASYSGTSEQHSYWD